MKWESPPNDDMAEARVLMLKVAGEVDASFTSSHFLIFLHSLGAGGNLAAPRGLWGECTMRSSSWAARRHYDCASDAQRTAIPLSRDSESLDDRVRGTDTNRGALIAGSLATFARIVQIRHLAHHCPANPEAADNGG